jgi:L-alanine-DL-glutamate epimerase-like enolase superfamily enzyme
VRAIKLLEPYDIAFVEQPVRMDDLEAARFVRAHVDVPIALDESVRGPREALAAVKAGACDIFVVKLMKTGGILNALKVNAIAEAAGITIMMGNMGESSLGLAAHFHVNTALANATHCDADLTWRPGGYAQDIGHGLRAELRGGVSTVLVPKAPGLGITLDEDAIAAQRVARRW